MRTFVTTTPPVFWGVGSFRPMSQPRREVPFLPPPTTPDALLYAAFTAEGAIECIHDLTSLETASQALLFYEKTLLDATPDEQLEARDLAFIQGIAIPTVYGLTNAYLNAWRALYIAVHSVPSTLDTAI